MKLDARHFKQAAEAAAPAVKAVNTKIDRACERAFPMRPQQVKNGVAGATTGLPAGTAVGGVGLAALDTAIGVPGAAVVAILAWVGWRAGSTIGSWKDKRRLRADAPVPPMRSKQADDWSEELIVRLAPPTLNFGPQCCPPSI